MTHDEVLARKLGAVDHWVSTEFGFIEELMQSLGCDSRAEGGPGLAFVYDGRVALNAHPKVRHLALGFSDVLRPDVDALNPVPRVQKGRAWLNYAPGVCDREQLEALIAASVQHSPGAATPRRANDRVHTPSPALLRNDTADLTLILAVLLAYVQHSQETGRAPAVKVLREAIYFTWEHPRLPPGGKYSPHLPHSPAAAARRREGKKGGLVFEHVQPISSIIRLLLADPPTDVAELRTVLENSPGYVIITQEEDKELTAAGYRNSAPDAADPWSRYVALKLDRQKFVALVAATSDSAHN